MVQWLGLGGFIVMDQGGSIPDQGTKIPQGVHRGQKKKKKHKQKENFSCKFRTLFDVYLASLHKVTKQ